MAVRASIEALDDAAAIIGFSCAIIERAEARCASGNIFDLSYARRRRRRRVNGIYAVSFLGSGLPRRLICTIRFKYYA